MSERFLKARDTVLRIKGVLACCYYEQGNTGCPNVATLSVHNFGATLFMDDYLGGEKALSTSCIKDQVIIGLEALTRSEIVQDNVLFLAF